MPPYPWLAIVMPLGNQVRALSDRLCRKQRFCVSGEAANQVLSDMAAGLLLLIVVERI